MKKPSRAIPERFRDQIVSMPEYSYGVNRLIVTLDNGMQFSDVFVGWGEEIIKVGSSIDVPFDPERIVKVEKQ